MFSLLPTLALLGALAAPTGASRTCRTCYLPHNCTQMPCASEQDACLFSQLQLENGTVLENGSCAAPGECREGVYSLTYGPHPDLWVSTVCCANCSRAPEPRQEAEPNAVVCPYCSDHHSALCNSRSVMNCTGNQTACVTLRGTWPGGDHQTLMGCGTPEVCHLRENDTLGPKESGFRLSTRPQCSFVASSTTPDFHATTKGTICFTCSDLHHCTPLPCPEDRSYCLQRAGITVLGKGNSVSWRNGSCVTSGGCELGTSISTLTYGTGFGFLVNTTCCQGNCQDPIPLAAKPAPRGLNIFMCPTCLEDQPGRCNSSLYMQCPRGETECIQMDLVSKEGGRDVTLRGCGSRNLCTKVTQRTLMFPGYGQAHRLYCSTRSRGILHSQCRSNAAPETLRLALPLLAVVLGTMVLS